MSFRCLLGKRVLAEIASQLADLRGHLTELYSSSALRQLGYCGIARLINVGQDLHLKQRGPLPLLSVHSGSTGFTCRELTLKLDMSSLGP